MASDNNRSLRPKSRFYSGNEVLQMFETDIPSDSEDERLDGDDTDNELDPNFEPAVPDRDDETSTTSDEDDDDGQSPDHSYVEECDDDLNDPTQSQPSKRQRTMVDGAPRTFHWVKKDLPAHVNPENHLIPRGKAAGATTIMEMFLAHFDNDAFELLTLESNRFMGQCGRTRCTKIHVQELKTFVGICMYMSIVCLPSRRMYWSPGTRQVIVANAMTVNRFEDIMSLFHCNDNTLMKGKGEVGYDRLHKVRPLINIINRSFTANAEPEAFVAIDEQMIPFKGRHGLKCYMMKKPKKWGYKVWVHAGRSGYVHCLQFAGDNTVNPVENVSLPVGKPGEVVLSLTQNQPENSYIFFDNYFACPELLVELKERKLNATCTVRPNRSRKCPLLAMKDLKKRGRGSYDYRSDSDGTILLCEWFDNKIVLVGSNIHGVEPTHTVRRYDRTRKEYIYVKCPGLIKNYNQSMGGVDKCDMLLEFYRMDFKSKKWYKRILFHLLDLCVVNSWLLYKAKKADCAISLCAFKLQLAQGFIKSIQAVPELMPDVAHSDTRSVRSVNEAVRYDKVDHFSMRDKEAKFPQRCKLPGCSRKSQFKCRKRNVVLCITPVGEADDCFYVFHHNRKK